MFDLIVEIDKAIIVEINHWHTPRLDDFFLLFTGQKVWFLAIALLLFLIIKNYKWQSIWVLIVIAITITLADQISSTLIKPMVERLRPSCDPSLAERLNFVYGYRSGGYSFVSSHAANSFGFAVCTSLLFRNKIYGWTIFIWAALTCFSRIYLAVHYTSDILAGALIGVLSAFFAYFLFRKIRPMLFEYRMCNRYALAFLSAITFTSLAIFVFHNYFLFLL